MMFQCFTGYYAILTYSDILLAKEFDEEQRKKVTARPGTYLVVLSNFLGSIASIYFIHRVNRRTILLIGQASISLALAGMAIMTVAQAPDLLLLMICIVTFMF